MDCGETDSDQNSEWRGPCLFEFRGEVPLRNHLMRFTTLLRTLVAIIVALGAACCDSNSATMSSLSPQLGRAVSKLKVGEELRVADLNSAPWEKLVVVAPYTPTSVIETAIGGKVVPEIKAARIEERDDINLLIF